MHGVRVCRWASFISHLLFVDDSIIFGRANVEKIRRVKRMLEVYEEASGQKINLSKSDIVFSADVGDEWADYLARELGVRRLEQLGIYLGLLMRVGRSREAMFRSLVRMVKKKVKD